VVLWPSSPQILDMRQKDNNSTVIVGIVMLGEAGSRCGDPPSAVSRGVTKCPGDGI